MALLKVERAQGQGAKGGFSTTALLPFLPCPRPRRRLGVLADAATRATPRRAVALFLLWDARKPQKSSRSPTAHCC